MPLVRRHVVYLGSLALVFTPLAFTFFIPAFSDVILCAVLADAFSVLGAEIADFFAPFANILGAAPAKRAARSADAVGVSLALLRALGELGALVAATAPTEALVMALTVIADNFATVEARAAGHAPARRAAPRRSLAVLVDLALAPKGNLLPFLRILNLIQNITIRTLQATLRHRSRRFRPIFHVFILSETVP